MTRGFIWLPSFSKEVFSDIINEYQLKLFDESESNIAFENEYIYWGMQKKMEKNFSFHMTQD
ncbi:hypothetical protein [Viscerimonas tarda]